MQEERPRRVQQSHNPAPVRSYRPRYQLHTSISSPVSRESECTHPRALSPRVHTSSVSHPVHHPSAALPSTKTSAPVSSTMPVHSHKSLSRGLPGLVFLRTPLRDVPLSSIPHRSLHSIALLPEPMEDETLSQPSPCSVTCWRMRITSCESSNAFQAGRERLVPGYGGDEDGTNSSRD
jgi:hypothetical protein